MNEDVHEAMKFAVLREKALAIEIARRDIPDSHVRLRALNDACTNAGQRVV
jgi:hypothetical protein